MGPWSRDEKSYLECKEVISLKCLENPVFAGNEPNKCVLLLRQAAGKSGCVCPLFTAHRPVPSVHSVLYCLISCWRFGARVWLSLGEHFQHRSGNWTWKGRVGSYLLRFAVAV